MPLVLYLSHLQTQGHLGFLLCYLQEHFCVLHLGLWSIFILVKGVSSMSRLFFFFFWHVDIQLFQHHLLKYVNFFNLYFDLANPD